MYYPVFRFKNLLLSLFLLPIFNICKSGEQAINIALSNSSPIQLTMNFEYKTISGDLITSPPEDLVVPPSEKIKLEVIKTLTPTSINKAIFNNMLLNSPIIVRVQGIGDRANLTADFVVYGSPYIADLTAILNSNNEIELQSKERNELYKQRENTTRKKAISRALSSVITPDLMDTIAGYAND